MEPSTPLPFVVHVGGYQGPSDVIEALSLGEFVAGRQPCAVSTRLHRLRSDATLVPAGVEPIRQVVERGRRMHVAVGPGWTLHAVAWKDRTADVTVTASSHELASRVLGGAIDGAVEPAPPADEATNVGFWRLDGKCGRRVNRLVAAAPWPSIRRNYASTVVDALDQLMAIRAEQLAGRLLLLHGPPGTGKTTLLRALAHAWRGWCRVDYVIDPEKLLERSSYLMDALLDDDDDNDEDDDEDRSPTERTSPTEERKRWRMLVLEDCDELIRVDAKRQSGQALARMLNLTDGLVGHGLSVLVCITTNEDLHRLHPAIVRPGRCLAHVHIGRLSPSEAAAWLGNGGGNGHGAPIGREGATLAELFALRGDLAQVEKPADQQAAFGHYL